ncbi:rab11 family-interacting protein hypothetical protein [Limosa lapponica baueri]|uniref:Uncharacterized protein n=1 Tax=Limosa lapponica baueri TaxID=1758121 RepID=A0A2I0T0U9_LIMLA|nr:rab11 family-interacting protein hypothetical protein [Limosa lapponica baueri]
MWTPRKGLLIQQSLIEDLRKQLEHLQLFKLEAEQRRGRSSSVGLQEYNSRTRETELEQEIKQLKQDNRNLKEQNDELNGQIINLSIQGAKNLFSASFSESLAAEISSVSRDEPEPARGGRKAGGSPRDPSTYSSSSWSSGPWQ